MHRNEGVDRVAGKTLALRDPKVRDKVANKEPNKNGEERRRWTEARLEQQVMSKVALRAT
jgi:hypothetical protein